MPRLLGKKRLLYLGATTGGAALGYALPPFELIRAVTEHHIPQRNSHEEALAYVSTIENEMMALPLVKRLQNNPDYTMQRAWQHGKDRSHVLTAGTLLRPGGFNITPVVFTNVHDKSTISITHCGRLLTGFPMIVHGGVLATILDEALGRQAIGHFGSGAGVTANLSLKYKAPTLAHQFLVVKTHTNETTGRKAYVSGTIETVKGKRLVQADGTFVEPRSYKLASLRGM